MRQRKAKNLNERLQAFETRIVGDPAAQRGRWATVFDCSTDAESSMPLYLELGCGKGKFIRTLASLHPDAGFLGIEGQETVVLRALEQASGGGCAACSQKAAERCDSGQAAGKGDSAREQAAADGCCGGQEMPSNLRFVCAFAHDLSDFFAEGELSGIYLNFSDPWPKARHAKRRLTHCGFLVQYARVLAPGAFLEFKTDNDQLFAFTLEEMKAVTGSQLFSGDLPAADRATAAAGDVTAEAAAEAEAAAPKEKQCIPKALQNAFRIDAVSYDLHRDGLPAAAVTTEYEDKFSAMGIPIKYVRLVRR